MSQRQPRRPGVDGTHHGVTGGYGWSGQECGDTVELPRGCAGTAFAPEYRRWAAGV